MVEVANKIKKERLELLALKLNAAVLSDVGSSLKDKSSEDIKEWKSYQLVAPDETPQRSKKKS